MSGRYLRIKTIIIICIITALLTAGCGLLRPAAPKEEENKKKNPPKALTQMEKDTDGIIKDLEEVREKRARLLREEQHPSKESPPKDQQGQQMQQSQEQQGQQQGQEGGENKNQQEGQQQSQEQGQHGQQAEQPKPTPKPMPEPDWNNLESVSESLHDLWNSYEPVAKSDGAMSESIKGFEEQLISLTEQIMARNEENTLVAANALYLYFPDFLKLYSHNQPPEIKQLKGLARQIIINGQRDKWEETKPLLDQMKLAWQDAKTKIKKPDKMLNGRIEAALSDFNSVVSERKINLAVIKGAVLIKNLDQVE